MFANDINCLIYKLEKRNHFPNSLLALSSEQSVTYFVVV